MWSKQSRHKRGYGSAWDKTRKHILSRDSYLCQPCIAKGRVTPATQVDHIKPKAQGGTDDADNLQAICTSCHTEKTATESASLGVMNHPDWLERSAIPLYIVCGPPCSGKTTHIAQSSNYDDIIIDLDMIQAELRPSYRHWAKATDGDLLNQALRVRNTMLGKLSRASSGRAWFIVSAPTKAERDWWQAKLGGEIVLINPGKDECKARAKARGTPLAIAGVDKWFRKALEPWSPPKPKVQIGLDGWPI